jgi:magnesium and cobalt exporter, CNNM family
MPNISADLVRLLAVPVLVALNGFFVAAEFALVKIRWTKVEELVDQGRFGALAVREAAEKLDDAIAATQLGITIASLALGWIGEPSLAHLIEPALHAMHLPWSLAVAHGIAVTVAFFLITYMHVVLGELAPKAIALQRPEVVALWTAGTLLVFGRVFRPFIRLVAGTGRWIVRQLRLPPLSEAASVHSVEELQMLVEETEEAGVIPTDQATYVQNVFELSEKTVRDIMVPREKVVTLSLRMSPEEVLEVCRETAHTRMPVWDGTPDNVVGVVNTKDLFHLFSLRGVVILMDAMYEPLYVHANMSVARLLRNFKRVRRPMAVVQAEDGKFLGIVTLEDILEEIVGEIEDEHDAPEGAMGAVAEAAQSEGGEGGGGTRPPRGTDGSPRPGSPGAPSSPTTLGAPRKPAGVQGPHR